MDAALQDSIASQDKDEAQPQSAKHFRQWTAGFAATRHTHHAAAVTVIGLAEHLLTVLLAAVSLDNLHIVETLLV